METQEFEFIAPTHWFGSRALRRWLWMRINRLCKETCDNLRQTLTEEIEVQDERDFYSVVRFVILNINYSEIISLLEGDDFKNFAEYAKEYWTDPRRFSMFPKRGEQIKIYQYL